MFTKTFWAQAFERALKTFAQAVLAMLTGDGLGLLGVGWGKVASVAALAALLSLLTSVVTAGIGQSDSPSAVRID